MVRSKQVPHKKPAAAHRKVEDEDATKAPAGPEDEGAEPGVTAVHIIAGKKARKKRRMRPGMVALREIRRYQKSTELLLRKLPFRRLVREILSHHHETIGRISNQAMLALQEASEVYLTQFFEEAYQYTLHDKRVTLQERDLKLVRNIRGTRL